MIKQQQKKTQTTYPSLRKTNVSYQSFSVVMEAEIIGKSLLFHCPLKISETPSSLLVPLIFYIDFLQ